MGEVRSGGRRRSLVVLAGALAVVLLLLTVLSACGSSSSAATADAYQGNWLGADKEGMYLFLIIKNGDGYKVYGNPAYPLPDPSKQGDELVVDTHAVVLTFTPAGTDKMTLRVSGSKAKEQKTIDLKNVSKTKYADAATAQNVATIREGLRMWKSGGGKKYPPAKEVTATGIIGQMVAWPINLFSGQPMQQGTDKGDFTYKRLDGGKSYSLKGYLSDGSTVGK